MEKKEEEGSTKKEVGRIQKEGIRVLKKEEGRRANAEERRI